MAEELKPFPPVPLELRDHILDYRVAAEPEDAHEIATFTPHLRSYLRHHLKSNLRIFAGPPNPGNPGRQPFIVRDTKIVQFLADVKEFHTTFQSSRSDAPNISFGEIENVQIHLPFKKRKLVNGVRDMLTSLRRPIKQIKFTGWVGLMTVPEYVKYVGELGQGLTAAETLTLVFNHAADGEDDEDEDELSAWRLWHRAQFFQCLQPFSSLTCLKVRTATELFPVLSDTQENARDWEDAWVAKVGEEAPSLCRVHLFHAFSEQHTATESQLYTGIRILRYRETPTETWSRGHWCFPAANKKRPKEIALSRHMRNPRTTQKIYFDAWQSDSEYPESVESGW